MGYIFSKVYFRNTFVEYLTMGSLSFMNNVDYIIKPLPSLNIPESNTKKIKVLIDYVPIRKILFAKNYFGLLHTPSAFRDQFFQSKAKLKRKVSIKAYFLYSSPIYFIQ